MVRRLKEDIREVRGGFPKRNVEPVVIENLPPDAPELVLSSLLDEYRTARERRHENRLEQGESGCRVARWSGFNSGGCRRSKRLREACKVHRATVEAPVAEGGREG